MVAWGDNVGPDDVPSGLSNVVAIAAGWGPQSGADGRGPGGGVGRQRLGRDGCSKRVEQRGGDCGGIGSTVWR